MFYDTVWRYTKLSPIFQYSYLLSSRQFQVFQNTWIIKSFYRFQLLVLPVLLSNGNLLWYRVPGWTFNTVNVQLMQCIPVSLTRYIKLIKSNTYTAWIGNCFCSKLGNLFMSEKLHFNTLSVYVMWGNISDQTYTSSMASSIRGI